MPTESKHGYQRRGYVPTRAEIEQHYLQPAAATLKEAARAIGCSYNKLLVGLRLHKVQAKPKTRNWRRRSAIPELQDREWLAAQLRTKPMHKIARELDTTVGNVADKAYRFGIVTPNTGAHQEGFRKAYPEGRFGPLAANWKGGRRYHWGKKGGYVLVYMPEHPYARRDGYVYEHRLVVEHRLGRYLTEKEVVDHKNGIKDDNRDENLVLWASRSEHVRNHFAATAKLARYEALYGPLPEEET